MVGKILTLHPVRVVFLQSECHREDLIHNPWGLELLSLRRLVSFPEIHRALLLLLELKYLF